jgi:competence protein ComEC
MVGLVIENMVNPIFGYFAIYLLAVLLISILIVFLFKKSILRDKVISVLILTSLLIAGFTYSQVFKYRQFLHDVPLNGVYTAIVHEKVPSTNNRFKFTLKLECAKENNNFQLINEKIVLYSSDTLTNQMVEPGNEIVFKAHLNEISNNKNPGEFDFKSYMRKKGIRYQASVKSGITISATKRNTPLTIALNMRTKLMQLYKDAGIVGDEYAVLGALTLGDQNYISNEVKNCFAASGAMHVLSVSGLHVGIIFLVLNFLCKPFDRRNNLKIPKVIILLGSLWIYAFITGLSPSVLRSTTMFSFLVIGENSNRRTNTYNTLAVSAFLLLLLNPFILFDIGFQLSYLAVFSIVFFQPLFASLIVTKNIVSKYLCDLVTVSLAAQLGTTPVSIFYFHQFPSYFLLSNLIVVPAAAIILYVGMLFFAVSFIPYLSDFLAFLLKHFTAFLNYCVKTIETLPLAVIDGFSISLFTVVLSYLFIAAVSSFMITNRGNRLLLSLSILLLLVLQNIYVEIRSNRQEKIIFYNNRNEPLISYIDGENHYYFSTSDSLGKYSLGILKSSSEKFRTKKPVCMFDKRTISTNRILTELKINNIPVSIITKNISTDDSLSKESIRFYPTESYVRFSPSVNYTVEGVGHDSIDASRKLNDIQFSVKNNGALILDLKK